MLVPDLLASQDVFPFDNIFILILKLKCEPLILLFTSGLDTWFILPLKFDRLAKKNAIIEGPSQSSSKSSPNIVLISLDSILESDISEYGSVSCSQCCSFYCHISRGWHQSVNTRTICWLTGLFSLVISSLAFGGHKEIHLQLYSHHNIEQMI